MCNQNVKTLTFVNPTLNDGVNVAVIRRGEVVMGDKVSISLGGNYWYPLTIFHLTNVPFSSITEWQLINHHDEESRTPVGLLAKLREQYVDFSEDETVSVISFIVNKRIPVFGDMVFGPDMVPYCRGQISEVIPLNDDFYEICWETRTGMDDRAVVHSANYLNDVIGGNDGWFIVKTYRHP